MKHSIKAQLNELVYGQGTGVSACERSVEGQIHESLKVLAILGECHPTKVRYLNNNM